MIASNLIGVYLFGSVSRGEIDDLSDLDILAVVEDGEGKLSENIVLEKIPHTYANLIPSISWYGKKRLAEMFKNGELFAWHIYQENIPLYDPNNFLEMLDIPSFYADSLVDVKSFFEILSEIPIQLKGNKNNAVYEAGLIYICLRNICMSASSTFNHKPDFSRYSPFNLQNVKSCPISMADYKKLLMCRLSGQRGIEAPREINSANVLEWYQELLPWIKEIIYKLEIGYEQSRT